MTKFYVMYPVRFFSYENPGFIDKNETDAMLVFFILGKLSNFHERTRSFVNVSLLDGLLRLDPKSPTRSRKRIVTALEVLEQKGYITMKYDSNERICSAPLIEVQVIDKQESSLSGASKYDGFVKVTEELFELANGDGKLLKILVYTLWRQNIDYSISFKEWSKVLGVSEKTARNLIKQYEEHGKLVVQHGEHYRDEKGKVRQAMNKYRIPSSPLLIKKKESPKETSEVQKESSSVGNTFETEDGQVRFF